jgi:ankyrin repeat protein
LINEAKAKVCAKDKFKKSALTHAVKNGRAIVVSYLLQHGADFNEGDTSLNTPLHYAAAYGFYECIDLLIKCNADINAHNIWCLTPCSIALS